MSSSLVSICSRAAIVGALLVLVLETGALAQTNDERGGFTVREVSLSTGYASVRLPPITLGGHLPNDILDADLITTGAAEIEWRRVTPRTKYRLDLFGTYSARTRYTQLSAPDGDLTFGVSRALRHRWRLEAGVANAIISSGQLVFPQTDARRLVDGTESFEDLAGTIARARSPNPDSTQAALFVPISQTLAGADLHGSRVMASSVRVNTTYAHSARLASYFRGSYTSVRRISSGPDPEPVSPSPDSTAEGAGVGIRYDRSERTQLTAALDWSQTSGDTAGRVVFATVGYGWTGRKWFTAASVGAAWQPFEAPVADVPLTPTSSRKPSIVYTAAIGYKFRAHTLLAQYSRAPQDEYGNGGRNVATGFGGDVQSGVGAWSWAQPRGRWMAEADFSAVRRPGNFSYIYTWLSTAGVGRQLGPNIRLIGQLFFNRNGSRAFEGFHLTRHGARVNFVWTPRRQVTPSDSDQ